jgi:hypothetical protein
MQYQAFTPSFIAAFASPSSAVTKIVLESPLIREKNLPSHSEFGMHLRDQENFFWPFLAQQNKLKDL